MEGLRIKRLIKHLTQEDLAEKLGVTPTTIVNWEKDRSKPSSKMLKKISEFFDCEIRELF